MTEPPFDFPSRPLDPLLAKAGDLERVARAVLRTLRQGGIGALRAALAQERRSGSAGGQSGASTGAAAPAGAPILYLPAVAWSYRFQRPQQLARALARAGHPVLYVEGFLRSRLQPVRGASEVAPGVHRLRLRVPRRPDPYREPLTRTQAEALARIVVDGLRGAHPAMILVQLPFWAELGRELARLTGAPLVYDRIDLHGGFPGIPEEVEEAEERLIRGANLVSATAGLLAERPRELNERVLLLPNGVDVEAFPALVARERAPRDPNRPVRAGYVGALGPWFDAEAVRHAAQSLPEWSFPLAGKVEDRQVAALAALPNVKTLGEIPFQEVPAFLAHLDVALVPFRDLPLTRAVDPVKLYEALASGLPVVARRLPEVERWSPPLVYPYSTPEEFVEALRKAVAEDSPENARTRRLAAERESWEERAGVLLGAVRI